MSSRRSGPRRRAAPKEIVKALLPPPAVRRVQRALAARARRSAERTTPIDLSRAELIREASVEQLADPAYLEHELLPSLGLNDERLHQFPPSLYPYTGDSLRHWQSPSQFSKYLAELSRQEIESYLEIGVRHGGTFVITVEYLDRFHPVRRAIGADLGRSPGLERYAESRPGVTVLKADSRSESFASLVAEEGPFDLVLIDGDHSYEGCREDLALVLDRTRIIALHDIVTSDVPGVRRVWQELKELHADRFEFVEITDQYPELQREAGEEFLGIGMAIARREAPDAGQ